MVRVVNLLSDYPKQGEAAHLTAILSFIQERRKKRGLFSRREEVIGSIRRGILPLKRGVKGRLSLICDGVCALEPTFTLEDVPSWEDAISSLRSLDPEASPSRAEALASLRPPSKIVRLRGVLPSYLFPPEQRDRGRHGATR